MSMYATFILQVAPMSMYASLGSEAVALRDRYVSRLQSLTEDTKLKIAILEFIATAVETQPGLIELFLDLKEKDKNNQEFTLGDHSCLLAVLSMVHPSKQVKLSLFNEKY
ncbi:Nucleoporin NUP188-like [Exaiptasia diaphana]|nr:Nucleoporin NUP188-like [Exaiptasia diaphana]